MFAVCWASFAWFLWRMAPSLTVGDAGEFAAAGATLGVAHAPGYPFYLLLGKAALAVFPGSLAYRLNLLSVMLMAAGSSVLWLLCRRQFGLSIWAALALWALFISEPHALTVGTEIEVFALLVFGALLIFWLLWERRFLAAAFALGLFMGNHHTLILLAPAYAILAFSGQTRRHVLNILAGGALAFFLGLSVYAYLPVAAARQPALNWGNPSNWPRFWHVLTRKDYGSTKLTVEAAESKTAGNYRRQAKRFAQGLGHEPAGAVLSVLGLLGLAVGFFSKERRAWTWSLAAGFFFSGPFFLFLGNPPFDPQTSGALERFYLLPLICLALAAPMGMEKAFEAVRIRRGEKAAAGVSAALGALAFFLSMTQPLLSRRGNYLVYDYGKNLLKSIAPNAYFFMEGGDDTMYSLAYLILAERRRPDLGSAADPKSLRVRDRAGLVYPSIYGFEFRSTPRDVRENMRAAFENNLARTETLFYQTLSLDLIEPARLLPAGLVQLRREKPPAMNSFVPLWPFYSLRGLEGGPSPHYRERSLIPYYYFARGQTAAHLFKPADALIDFRAAVHKGGDALWLYGNVSRAAGLLGAQAGERRLWAEALPLFEFAARQEPGEATHLLNACVVLDRMNRLEESLACYLQVSRVHSDFAPVYKNWGATLLAARRFSEAGRVFGRYYELTRDPQALVWIRQAK